MDYYITIYVCSALFGNLRYFEIALHILSIAKLRANFEIAGAISKLCNETIIMRNLEIEQDKPALDVFSRYKGVFATYTWLEEKGR